MSQNSQSNLDEKDIIDEEEDLDKQLKGKCFNIIMVKSLNINHISLNLKINKYKHKLYPDWALPCVTSD